MSLAPSTFRGLLQANSIAHRGGNIGCVALMPVRGARHKPWDPKFRLMRRFQPWPTFMDLGALRRKYMLDSPVKVRETMRREGFLWNIFPRDRPINIANTGRIMEPYLPPEDRGYVSKAGLKEIGGKVLPKDKNFRTYEPTFSETTFPMEAQTIYFNVCNLLQDIEHNESELIKNVTEFCLVDMVKGLRRKSLRWKFHESIEAPRVVQIRSSTGMSPSSIFGQVTVRFFTKQSFAIYDRFGRLLHGNEDAVRDMMEYVVFEKHISDEYGVWRVHGKIMPKYMQDKTIFHATVPIPPKKELEDAEKLVAERAKKME